MNRAWQVTWWLRSAETWLRLMDSAALWGRSDDVAKALRSYDDAINEVLL